jgi:hypothetical protein
VERRRMRVLLRTCLLLGWCPGFYLHDELCWASFYQILRACIHYTD